MPRKLYTKGSEIERAGTNSARSSFQPVPENGANRAESPLLLITVILFAKDYEDGCKEHENAHGYSHQNRDI